ncbi:MAG TPA: alpha/beta hydrolase [Vicinamibacterales bacterium]|nr:alpha/beta hydrolase [Vicinamibacterales bacterium]
MNRRDLFKQVAAVAAVAPVAARQLHAAAQGTPAPEGPAPVERFFPAGFTRAQVKTSGATINVVKGGDGPPLLLLHGAPQTHITWRNVAAQLAKQYTLIIPDLRGYGDSSKPADTPDHINYSKRNMALDQIEVMKHFGFDRFPVAGQDRGGRVGQRLALDHPNNVTKLAVLDIVPTHYHYTHVTLPFVQAYFHWFNYLRPAPPNWPDTNPAPAGRGRGGFGPGGGQPAPEMELLTQAQAQRARVPMMNEVQREYYRTTSDPANIHGMCEDYRASASVDLDYDNADMKAGRKITAPVLALWSTRGPIGRLFDVENIWKEYAKKVTGKGLDGGHYLQEDVPELVMAELLPFLKA